MISNNYTTSYATVSGGGASSASTSTLQVKSNDLVSSSSADSSKNAIGQNAAESEVSLMSPRELQSHIYLRSIVEHLKLEMPNNLFPSNNKLSERISLPSSNSDIATSSISEGGNTVEAEEPADATMALFDFDAVTKEVMSFVSAALSNAKERGSNDEELKFMFEQAHVGVGMGIDEAVEELEEFSLMNDDIMSGIEKSRTQITEELDKLRQSYFPDENEKIA